MKKKYFACWGESDFIRWISKIKSWIATRCALAMTEPRTVFNDELRKADDYRPRASRDDGLFKRNRITAFDITLFLRQFSTMLTAGIPILRCLNVLEQSQVKTSMRLLVYSIKRELLSGKDVTTCLNMHPLYFDEFTCQLVRIGEHTGQLDTTLQMIADEHEKRMAFKKRIKSALFYPCILSCTAIMVTISLFLFVIPRFAELFANTQVQLPLLTRILFFLSATLNDYLYLVFLPIIFIASLFFLPHSFSWKIKKSLSAFIYKLPWLHSLIQKILLARFSRHLAMTFSAGISITEALSLLTHHEHHPGFSYSIFHLRSKIQSGLHLHQAMQALPQFPELMIQMVKIGEESGALDQMLLKISGILDQTIDDAMLQFSKLLEPLIMLVLGVLIGGLIVGMYLPIFKLGSIL